MSILCLMGLMCFAACKDKKKTSTEQAKVEIASAEVVQKFVLYFSDFAVVKGKFVGVNPISYEQFKNALVAYAVRYESGAQVERISKVHHKPTHALAPRTCYQWYDERGLCVQQAFYHLDGTPSYHPAFFYSLAKYKYDEQGRMVERAYFDPAGRPASFGGLTMPAYVHHYIPRSILIDEGYARATRTYNSQGLLAEEVYWGADGKFLDNADPIRAYARVQFEYDSAQRLTRVTCYNANNNPFKVHTFFYNEAGNLVLDKWTLPDGETLMLCAEKFDHAAFAQRVQSYDSHGRCVSIAYLNVDETLCRPRETYTYNDVDRGMEIKYVQADGSPMPPERRNKAMRHFDEAGRMTEESFYNGKGELMLCGLYCKMTRKYDAYGNCVDEAYYDCAGQLTVPFATRDEQANDIFRQDADDRWVAVNRKPAIMPNISKYEYTRRTAVYDATGRCLQERFYFLAGASPTASVTCSYNANGDCVETCHYNTQGLPAEWVHASGNTVSRVNMIYNDRHQPVQVSYYSADGTLVHFEELHPTENDIPLVW